MGNHEDMLIDYIEHGRETWFLNGNSPTISSYNGDKDALWNDYKWMKTLPLYYEDNNYIYVHAGINVNLPMEKQNRDTMLWVRDEFIFNTKKYYKRVVFGHTPTIMLNGGYMPIYTETGNICIDTACVFDGKLTALIIENGKINEFYQVSKGVKNYER